MLVGRGQVATKWVMGFGHRVSWWDRDPTVAELDAVTGQVPTILISGDAHNGWLNSAALALFGVSHHEGPVFDAEWFPLYERVMAFGGWAEMQATGQADVLQHCLELGIVGFRDFSLTADPAEWVGREDFPLRVSLGVYPEGMEERTALGVRAGDPLLGAAFAGPDPRHVQGPLKVIADGSIGSYTAFCVDEYPASAGGGHGLLNVPEPELESLLSRATGAGLDVAVHAIGDAAVEVVLDAIARTGARGSVEHTQQLGPGAAERMGALALMASVQPLHLVQDRDAVDRVWPGRAEDVYAFRRLADAGVRLGFGSDAPVSGMEPWEAMAVAVDRRDEDDPRGPWVPQARLSAAEALAASVNGAGPVGPGSLGDLVLVDRDPISGEDSEEAAANLRNVRVVATIVGGDVLYEA